MVYKSSFNKYKQHLFNIYTAAVNGYSFLALQRKTLLSISSSKCLHLLFVIHLLYVWLQQRPDRQKGKRKDIGEIKDSEPKYPNLAYCSSVIKSVHFKFREPSCQQQTNQKSQQRNTIQQIRYFFFCKKDFLFFCSTSCLSTARAIWATCYLLRIMLVVNAWALGEQEAGQFWCEMGQFWTPQSRLELSCNLGGNGGISSTFCRPAH